jgi:hypothetical protein
MDDKTKKEMERGAQITARRFLAEQFDPDHKGFHVSVAERARRDANREHLGQWKKAHEPD